ncbi:hypothetical protein DY000_02018576 [Brassica cretica]|uniref:START domain-containing protein n=1 Tax=Brassica cretica TaxID=69181 RepID=A0ABQ7CY40_BRACR|nr:hypothetical protein DY000_02018576 [Brassica cretica]
MGRGEGREGSYETFVESGRVGQLSDLMSESAERLFNIVVEAQEHDANWATRRE